MSQQNCKLDEPLWSFSRELVDRFAADNTKSDAEIESYRSSLCTALNNLKQFLPTTVKITATDQATAIQAAQQLGTSIVLPKFLAKGGSRRKNRRRKTRKTRA